MSQIKAYNPEVALIVGINASLLLQHIKYWSETKSVEKVYRTNSQLSQDFKGSLSESQIQRAKKKLVEAGLILISHDMCYTRTTHYKLTEKAKSLLGMVKAVVDNVKKVVKKVVAKKHKSMSENFKEYGDTSHAVPMPADVLEKLRGIKKPVEIVEDESSEDLDEYFKALDESIAICKQKEAEPQLSFSELLSRAFNPVPNIEQLELNRKAIEDAQNFKEDY